MRWPCFFLLFFDYIAKFLLPLCQFLIIQFSMNIFQKKFTQSKFFSIQNLDVNGILLKRDSSSITSFKMYNTSLLNKQEELSINLGSFCSFKSIWLR
jgi:hypothetical protein